MRELTETEASSVTGGGRIGEFAADGGAIGTVVGYIADSTIAGATRGGLAGAMVGTSFGIGYAAGTYMYGTLSELLKLAKVASR